MVLQKGSVLSWNLKEIREVTLWMYSEKHFQVRAEAKGNG